ncbi:MAG: LLM class flavin-dependent oxidoreductase [Thermomicrobiales bacterium]|jgi:alkanesulfonate monooxygenase SsuD/methylene tetrahydromethanopterin reductase-like flavin-dependent oxidoreductase (luciferase family)|nr:LLM class flavin-dependent oxidoreductase [Thermomicrobiales bacterium]
MELGLFDIFQVDPTDSRTHGEIYEQRLNDVELAEKLGFSYYFCGELHFSPAFRNPSATALLAAASQRTSSIRLGAMAWTLPTKAPAQLAEDVAVLDWLSNGRIEAGLGLGHRVEELEILGVDPSNRIPSFQERAAVLQALWTGGQVSVNSDYTTIRGASLAPTPMQQPNPPLWFAGSDPDAATWIGSIGFSLALGFKPVADLAPAAREFRRAVEARRASKPERTLPREGRLALMRQIYLADSDETARQEMATDLHNLYVHNAGSERPVPPREEALRVIDGLIADEVFLAGSPESVANQIKTFEDELGFGILLANPYANGITPERVERSLTLLAAEVLPRLRSSS